MKHNSFFLITFLLTISLFSYSLYASDNAFTKASIITSVYNGDAFIQGFLEDIVKMNDFASCELILINANSPGNEEPIILEYCKKYSNIVYERLDHDPGIYGVWNYAIKKSRAPFITNANLDDRHHPDFLKTHIAALEQNPDIDLIYSDFLMTYIPNEPFETAHYHCIIPVNEFSLKNMCICLPGLHPMWRKSMHDKFGYFDEKFTSEGDFEFWNRAISQGSIFKKIGGISGIYYYNPNGISTTNRDPIKALLRDKEHQLIIDQYGYLWKD